MSDILAPAHIMGKEDTKFETVKTAQGIVEALIDTAKKVTLRDGRHRPMLFVITIDKVLIFRIEQFLKSDDAKDSLVNKVDELIKQFQPQGIGIIIEAWMIMVNNNIRPEELLQISASDHPKRIEVLQAIANWSDGSQYIRILRIIRDSEDKVIQLAELEGESGHSELGGRFTNFFSK